MVNIMNMANNKRKELNFTNKIPLPKKCMGKMHGVEITQNMKKHEQKKVKFVFFKWLPRGAT